MTDARRESILDRMDTLTPFDFRVAIALAIAAVAVGTVSAVSPLLVLFALVAILAIIVAWLDTPLYVILLVALTPLFDVGVITLGPVDLQFMEIAWFLAFLVLFLRILVGRPVRVARLPLWVPMVLCALVLWDAAAAQLSVVPVRSMVEFAQTAYLGTVMYVTAIVLGAFDTRDRARLLLASAWAFLGIFAVSAFWHYVLMVSFPRIIVDSGGMSVAAGLIKTQAAGVGAVMLERFGLVNIGPVASAAVFVVVLAYAVGALLDTRAARYRLLAFVVAAASGIGLLLTYSRAGWLVGVLVLWLLTLRAGPRKMAALTVGLGSLLGVVAAIMPAVSARLQEFTDLSEGSFAVHVRMWVTAIWMTAVRPLTGWGPGAFREIAPSLGIGVEFWPFMANQDAHNFVLQASAESGVIGAGLLLLLVLTLLGVTMRPAWQRGGLLAFAPWVAAVGILLMDLTLNTFRTEITWVTLGILLATSLWHQGREATSRQDLEV